MSLTIASSNETEITFEPDEIIVSKTNRQGKLTYANDVFCRVAEMSTDEVIGQPHNIIRHPDMPRVIFKLLWETIQSGTEIFAYVKNKSKTGKYYWVIAHVTPSFDNNGEVDGYHSNRRLPDSNEVEKISALYRELKAEEDKHKNPKEGLEASTALLNKHMQEQGMSYSEFVWSVRGAQA